MINPNELRLGNTILLNGKEVKVIGLLGRIITTQDDNGKYHIKCKDKYEPILPSEELLLKYGFRKIDKYTFVIKNIFIYHRVKRGFIHGSRELNLSIVSLHQIQNLIFSMKGIDIQPEMKIRIKL